MQKEKVKKFLIWKASNKIVIYGEEIMDRKKAISIFLLGTFTQIVMACIMVLLLRNSLPLIKILAIIIWGISSAFWGIIISNKYRGTSLKQVLSDFINIKKPYKYYLFIFMYLLLDFCYVVIGGNIEISNWYIPIVLFFKAIIFGGIEEIGWRYTFQPILEEKLNFTLSTIIIFILWGIWHFLYFYIDGSIYQVQVIPFLIGLLTNCFILATLFRITKSLSICVITHALINMFSQIIYGGNEIISIISSIIIIGVSITISAKYKNQSKT